MRQAFSGARVEGYSSSSLNLLQDGSVPKLAKKIGPNTLVIHSASKMKRDGDSPELLAQNITMTMNILRALKDHPPRAFVFISSQAVFGEERHHTSLTEKSPLRPTSFYGLSKKISEELIAEHLPEETETLILRPPFVYGSGDTTSYSPSGFLLTALRRERIILWGDGSEKREFLYVGDLSRILAELLRQRERGAFNLTGGTRTTFRTVVEEVEKTLHYSVKVSTRRRSKKKVDFLFGKGRLSLTLPGFQYTSLADGLAKTFAGASRKE